ncbi:xylulokinase [Aureimonas fodinaquatilis]|uniref:Xylulose kinase n=1 Tax=Aureimonas fodinaquatilis TaxID=2565783 RepID=A0A5B0DX14_9HYPH|nr:xylulokinase [Aureimonas fodinaquatilis]KAA0971013.1 xylulokinase [Aureimonas fodinaquatilis]
MAYYLGLDLGTSSLKALLIDENQHPLATAHAELKVQRPHFGWSEQDPDDWIAAARSAIAELRKEHSTLLQNVRGIGLSGQMHGATLIDADGTALRPCILWNDTRSHKQAALLDDDEARRITGNIVFPGFTAPKLLWLAEHEPETLAKMDKVLLPKDYLRFWLTGEAVSEMSDAAGTAWLDTGARAWSARMLERTGLNEGHMPRLVEGTQASGYLRKALAEELGLPAGIVVAGGAGDNAASACGVGVVAPGNGFISLGTSGVLFTATDGYSPAPETAVHTFCHALPGRWHKMGVTLSAAGSLEWLSSVTGTKPAELTAELPQDPQGPSRVLFLPYLAGERTPHNDAAVRGALIGLAAETSKADLTRAVMEGVAFSIRDCAEAGGGIAALNSLIAVGAGSRSALWLQILADVLQTTIMLPAAGDFGAAFGAARLAMCAAEGTDTTQLMAAPPIARTFEPDAHRAKEFDAAYQRYTAAYLPIRELSL